jgi:hypothetical protein
MLDTFLEVAYQEEQGRNLRNEMAEAMTALPTSTLHKLASGQEKLAFHGSMEGGCWLDQFSGTPQYEQAIQLEEQSIKLQAQSQAQRSDSRDASDQTRDAEDALRLKKKMLELDLRKGDSGGEEPAEHEAMESPMEEAAEEEMKEGSALRSMLVQSMRKEAGTLPPGLKAAKIPKGSDFDGDGKKGEGKGKPAFLKKSSVNPFTVALMRKEALGVPPAPVPTSGGAGGPAAIKPMGGAPKPPGMGASPAPAAPTMGKMSAAVADQWGRQMAHMNELEKDAFLSGVMRMGKGLAGVARKGFAGKGMAAASGKKGVGGAWEAGKNYMTTMAKKKPGTALGLMGAGAGAAGLAAGGIGGAAAS